jgi:4'-phosphopantetheinyl transferase EntD
MRSVDAEALAELFAAPVRVACGDLTDREEPLTPDEAAAIERAVAKRRCEFAAGRCRAREALAALGAPIVSLPRNPDGSPAWPAGVVGAITHSRRRCAAVVAWRRDALGLGIDLEERGRLGDGPARLVLADAEARAAAAHPLGLDLVRTVVFSAKESIYKAVFPVVRRFVGFREVTVDVQDGGALHVGLDASLAADLPAGAVIVVRWHAAGNAVATGATLLEQLSGPAT